MDTSTLRNLPPQPRSVEETGWTIAFLADLVLKTMHVHGTLLGHEIADLVKLPFTNVVDKVLEYLRRERLVDVGGAAQAGVGEASYRYVISDRGQVRARELMDQNQYVGAAPVRLEAYTHMVQAQSLAGQAISQDALKRALAHLVLKEAIINQLGPAINAARAAFLFGNTGNGKTSIGLAIGALPAGAIWIPYAVGVEGQIIEIFDALHHRVVAEKATRAGAKPDRKGMLRYLDRKTGGADANAETRKSTRADQRWVLIHRPLLVGGGELTLRSLELVFDPTMKYYQAPLPVKANGGVFLVDDLGRQQVSPRDILNRWVVPLEKRVDYLTLRTGHKINVPFDALVIFATNLDPKELGAEAFLRRLRYKIHITDPTWAEYREIFRREAAKRNIPYSEDGLQYVVQEYYLKPKRAPRGVHPRDILDGLVDIARYRDVPPTLSKPLLDLACRAYFLG